jgi:hypothetical protein
MDVFKQLLDHTVVDADGLPCGCVDDIIADRTATGGRIVALVIGPAALIPRLPAILQALLPKRLLRQSVRIPWSEVAHVSEVIELRSGGSKLGLGKIDRQLGELLVLIPGARRPE